MLTVGNGLGEYFQSPGYIFEYGNLSKNSQKIAKKNHRKLEDVLTGGDVIQKYVQSPGWTFKSGNTSKKAKKMIEN